MSEHRHKWTWAEPLGLPGQHVWFCADCGQRKPKRAARSSHPDQLEVTLDEERLAEAWGNVMDGRRIRSGLNAARIGRDTTTADDWRDIAREYAALSIQGRSHDQ